MTVMNETGGGSSSDFQKLMWHSQPDHVIFPLGIKISQNISIRKDYSEIIVTGHKTSLPHNFFKCNKTYYFIF